MAFTREARPPFASSLALARCARSAKSVVCSSSRRFRVPTVRCTFSVSPCPLIQWASSSVRWSSSTPKRAEMASQWLAHAAARSGGFPSRSRAMMSMSRASASRSRLRRSWADVRVLASTKTSRCGRSCRASATYPRTSAVRGVREPYLFASTAIVPALFAASAPR